MIAIYLHRLLYSGKFNESRFYLVYVKQALNVRIRDHNTSKDTIRLIHIMHTILMLWLACSLRSSHPHSSSYVNDIDISCTQHISSREREYMTAREGEINSTDSTIEPLECWIGETCVRADWREMCRMRLQFNKTHRPAYEVAQSIVVFLVTLCARYDLGNRTFTCTVYRTRISASALTVGQC